MLFLRLLERVLVWYASGHELVWNLQTHIYLAGVLTRKCDIFWSRHPPFGLYPH
jgi:hypothetical protein